MSHFGTAKFIESTKNSTIVVGGECSTDVVDEKIDSLKALIKDTPTISDAERLQKRIVRLASGVAVISVGGSTEVEMIEKKHQD
jgi:chaperonin GroEL